MSSRFNSLSFLIIFLFGFVSCTQSANYEDSGDDSNNDKKYSIYILGKDNKEYILETGTLNSGIVYPESKGAELDTKQFDRDVIVKDGYYYHLHRRKGFFVKYKLSEGSLQRLDSLEMRGFSVENFKWLGGDTLLLTGLSTPDFSKVKYVLLRAGAMEQIAAGDMDIPKPAGEFNSMSVGFVERRLSKLFVGYTYHQQLSTSDYTTSDTIYVAELMFPQMTAVKTDKDVRSAYPGGINTIQSYSFTDENGDYYFMTCPGIALGNRPELSTGIMRMQKDSDIIDKTYFINLSSSASHNHAYGMWYLGNGQAIVRSERKDLFRGLDDHYSTAHFEFYLVDLKNKKVLRKLNLPLDKGTRRECVIVQGDKAYIAVNSSKEGNYIWVYDIKSASLEKGLQLSGDTDFILRIDKLK